MSALLDTSILVLDQALDVPIDEWFVSVVCIGELEAGVLLAAESGARALRLRRLTAVLAEAPALPIDRLVAGRYAELRAASGRLPGNDLWTAATALAHDLTLVTADERQAALPLVRSQLVR